MKKIIIIAILIIIDIILCCDKSVFGYSKKIDLKLNKDQLAVSVIANNENKMILINNTDLLIIKGFNDVSKILNLYNIKILNNIIFLDKTIDGIQSYDKQKLVDNLSINNVKIIKKQNIIKLEIYKHTFCIYTKGNNKNFDDCNYVYIADYEDIDVPENVIAVIFDEKNKNVVRKYYDKWVDCYIINSNNIYIFKFSIDEYEVINTTIN